tara:strand:+ start:416 stop:709 length:294 start_codon:yes stop_codon:yes gene_type:complete
MVKLKDIILEKKELDSRSIDKLERLTDQNAHNMARELLAKMMRNKVLVKNYQALSTLHTFLRDMNDLKDARARLDKILFTQAEKYFSNFKDIYNRGF